MRHLSKISLDNLYGKDELDFKDISRSIYYASDMPSLINSFPKIKNPSFFRYRTIQMLQLFFDGVLDNSLSGREIKQSTKYAACSLISLGRGVVASFYRGKAMDFDFYCDRIFAVEQELLKCSIGKPPNPLHLEQRLDIIQKVGLSVQENTFPKDIDSLVLVANGGFETGLLVADILDHDFVLPIRFSNYNRISGPDQRAKCSNLFNYKNIRDHIKSKNVLVIEDLVCEGESLMQVMRYVQKRNPLSLVGISARVSDYYLNNYPLNEMYVKDARTHQFTLNHDQGLNEISHDDRRLLAD